MKNGIIFSRRKTSANALHTVVVPAPDEPVTAIIGCFTDIFFSCRILINYLYFADHTFMAPLQNPICIFLSIVSYWDQMPIVPNISENCVTRTSKTRSGNTVCNAKRFYSALDNSVLASSATAPCVALPPASMQSCFTLTPPSLESCS